MISEVVADLKARGSTAVTPVYRRGGLFAGAGNRRQYRHLHPHRPTIAAERRKLTAGPSRMSNRSRGLRNRMNRNRGLKLIEESLATGPADCGSHHRHVPPWSWDTLSGPA